MENEEPEDWRQPGVEVVTTWSSMHFPSGTHATITFTPSPGFTRYTLCFDTEEGGTLRYYEPHEFERYVEPEPPVGTPVLRPGRALDVDEPVPHDPVTHAVEVIEVIYRNKPFTFEGRAEGKPGQAFRDVQISAWSRFNERRRELGIPQYEKPDQDWFWIISVQLSTMGGKLSVVGSTTEDYDATLARVREQFMNAWDDMVGRNRSQSQARSPLSQKARPLLID